VLLAFTRAVPPSIQQCELTHLERTPIALDAAVSQHDRYEALLASLGCRVQRLEPAPHMPDSVFVEDTAVVLDEVAVIARPGTESRREEVASMAAALAPYRELRYIAAPATLDGGDVLRVGRRLVVGVTGRTSMEAVQQMRDMLRPFGYSVDATEVRGCLHLKTAVTAAADDLLVVNPAWVDTRAFEAECLPVDADEPFAANVLRIGDALVCADASARTAGRLRARGFSVHTIDVSELAKAEAGVTCCSVMCYFSESFARPPSATR
jgi:dimethylargininase